MAISVGSLLRDIQEHARAWVAAITKLMNTMCRQELMDLHELIGEFSANLDRNPDTLDDLKFILNMVAEIAGRSMEMELQYAALEDKYRTLRMYDYAVSEEEADMVDNMRARWAQPGPNPPTPQPSPGPSPPPYPLTLTFTLSPTLTSTLTFTLSPTRTRTLAPALTPHPHPHQVGKTFDCTPEKSSKVTKKVLDIRP